jgi:hypothetical protein
MGMLALWLILLAGSLACRALAIPGLIPTATPTPTSTGEPPLAPTPTATPEPTSTPSPERADEPVAEAIIEILPDSSVKFTDPAAGFELTLPPKWIVLDLSSGDIEKMFSQAAEIKPELKPLLENSKSMVANGARMFAMDTDPSHISGMSVPVIFILVDRTSASLPLDFLIEMTAQALPSMLPEAEVLSSAVSKNENGVEIGEIEIAAPVAAGAGQPTMAYEYMVIFKTDEGMVMTVMVTTSALRAALTPAFETVASSIKLLDP